MSKIVGAIIAIAAVLFVPLCCLADEADYSYLEDMSIKELRALDAEIHKLLGEAIIDYSEESDAEMIDEEAEPVLMNEEDFFADILESYTARDNVPKVTDAEWNMMTNDESVAYRKRFVEAEKEFANKYKNAVFEDLNIQYLCKQYVDGLFKQINAGEQYDKSQKQVDDYTLYEQNWNSGYLNRSYVIVELADYYDVAFPEDAVAPMRIEVDALESLNEAETRNAQVPQETVKEVQTLLHEIGFKCWNIDGIAGKKTVKAIKRFQEMYGYEEDGMIDDELIAQLQRVKADKGIVAESESENDTAS